MDEYRYKFFDPFYERFVFIEHEQPLKTNLFSMHIIYNDKCIMTQYQI